jgi:hypothetical protein
VYEYWSWIHAIFSVGPYYTIRYYTIPASGQGRLWRLTQSASSLIASHISSIRRVEGFPAIKAARADWDLDHLWVALPTPTPRHGAIVGDSGPCSKPSARSVSSAAAASDEGGLGSLVLLRQESIDGGAKGALKQLLWLPRRDLGAPLLKCPSLPIASGWLSVSSLAISSCTRSQVLVRFRFLSALLLSLSFFLSFFLFLFFLSSDRLIKPTYFIFLTVPCTVGTCLSR